MVRQKLPSRQPLGKVNPSGRFDMAVRTEHGKQWWILIFTIFEREWKN